MTMTETSTEVRRQVRIEARPETVYAFFTDPAKYVLWKGIEATLEPRPGGTYRVRIDDRHVASGRFVELVPHSRIVFSWGWEGEGHPVPPGSSTVEVTLLPDGAATMLTLVHRDLPDSEQSAIHAEGWDHFLSRLVAVAGGESNRQKQEG
jgi:uncharacterized protein YndB with AHSA1/START domain